MAIPFPSGNVHSLLSLVPWLEETTLKLFSMRPLLPDDLGTDRLAGEDLEDLAVVNDDAAADDDAGNAGRRCNSIAFVSPHATERSAP